METETFVQPGDHKKIELKNCPFCGGAVEMEDLNLYQTGHVVHIIHKKEATGCELFLSTPISFSPSDLAEKWNSAHWITSGATD